MRTGDPMAGSVPADNVIGKVPIADDPQLAARTIPSTTGANAGR
jgi:hypothetical protein